MSKPSKIVLKITDDIDPAEVLCTTYQMRNFYAQLGDGLATSLELMNYMQHHKASLMARSGDRVLDVCCGRGLMLPLLRWNRPKIASYTGVDIHPQNWLEATRLSATKDIRAKRMAPNNIGSGEPYYPFNINFLEANVASMAKPLRDLAWAPFDYVIYTSAIEHMQREDGAQSLAECYSVMKRGARLFLSSPNTADKRDPYDTQYAAHLYEWNANELTQELLEIGFRIDQVFGILAKVKGYREKLAEHYPDLVATFDHFSEYMPSAWLYSLFPVITPGIADEVVIVARR